MFILPFMKKIYNLLLITVIIVISCVAMIGCNSEKNNKTISLKNIQFELEGPLYSGSNPAQYKYEVDLKSILGKDYKEGATINSAVLTSAQIKTADSNTNFSNINSFVLSLASDNKDVKMQELALLNPILANSKMAELKPSTEANAKGFLKEKHFYIVLDADLKEDIEDNLKFTADLTFTINYN
jgi:hypothetical protein